MKLRHAGPSRGRNPLLLLFSWIPLLLLGQTLIKCTFAAGTSDGDGRIGISLDYKEGDSSKQQVWSYSAIMNGAHEDDVDKLSDSQLISLAKKAFHEMLTVQPAPPNGYPNAMGLFASSTGALYFASSFKGGRPILVTEPSEDKDDPLKKFDVIRGMLESCQSDTRPGHRLAGRCAEPNILDLFIWSNGGMTTGFDGSQINGRMVIWGKKDGAESVFGPCLDTGSRYGCATILGKLLPNVKAIKSGEAESDGTEIAKKFDQIIRWWRFFSCNPKSTSKA